MTRCRTKSIGGAAVLADVHDRLRHLESRYDHDAYVHQMLAYAQSSARETYRIKGSHRRQVKRGGSGKKQVVRSPKKVVSRPKKQVVRGPTNTPDSKTPDSKTPDSKTPDSKTEETVEFCRIDRKRAYFKDECKEYCALRYPDDPTKANECVRLSDTITNEDLAKGTSDLLGTDEVSRGVSTFIVDRSKQAVDTLTDVQNQLGVEEELEQRAINNVRTRKGPPPDEGYFGWVKETGKSALSHVFQTMKMTGTALGEFLGSNWVFVGVIGVFVYGVLQYCCHVMSSFREACTAVFQVVKEYLKGAIDRVGAALGVVADTIGKAGSTVLSFLPQYVQHTIRAGWKTAKHYFVEASEWMYAQVVYVCNTTWSMFDCAIRYNVRTPEFMGKMCIFGCAAPNESLKASGGKHLRRRSRRKHLVRAYGTRTRLPTKQVGGTLFQSTSAISTLLELKDKLVARMHQCWNGTLSDTGHRARSSSAPINLMPYQSGTIQYMEQSCVNQHGLLVYHNMGTGKTNTGVAWLVNRQMREQRRFKYLLVCPELVKSRWVDEAHQMGFPLAHKHVLNYDEFVHRYFTNYNETRLAHTSVIFDEAHHLAPLMRENNFARYSKVLKLFSTRHGAKGQRVLLLTGTPEYSDRSDFSLLLNVAAGKTTFPITERDWYRKYMDKRKVGKRAKDVLFNWVVPLSVKPHVWNTLLASIKGVLVFLSVKGNKWANTLLTTTGIGNLNILGLKIQVAIFSLILVILIYCDRNSHPTLALRNVPINYKLLAAQTGRYVSFYMNAPSNTDYAQVHRLPPTYYSYTDYQSKQLVQFLFGEVNTRLIRYYTGVEDDDTVSIRSHQFRTLLAMKKYGRCIGNTWEVVDDIITKRLVWQHHATGSVALVAASTDTVGKEDAERTERRVREGCPKFVKIKQMLLKCRSRDEKSMVRSDFKLQGAYLLSAFLTANHIDHVYIHKDVSTVHRGQLLDCYNHGVPLASRTGALFTPRIILLDPDASEGISLTCVEHVHFLEPPLYLTHRDQSIARAVRYRSHSALPASRRKVTVAMHAGIINTTAEPSYKLKEQITQVCNAPTLIVHRHNIETFVSKHFQGIMRRTNFTLVDYFINPTQFIHPKYTDNITPDTLVLKDVFSSERSQSEYMKHATGDNVLSPHHTLATDCNTESDRELKLVDFHA